MPYTFNRQDRLKMYRYKYSKYYFKFQFSADFIVFGDGIYLAWYVAVKTHPNEIKRFTFPISIECQNVTAGSDRA